MKRFTIFLLLLGLLYESHAQKKTTVANEAITPTPLEIGQKVPEIDLGPIDNNNTGKTKLSDFRGKLIILDTWNFQCGSCFANFPKMAALQEEFKDKVQVLLVNISNNNQEVIDWGIKTSRTELPANIPRIRNGKALIEKYFPPAGEVGYHIWIDENGRYIGRGPGPQNTYPAKIREYLAGKQVGFVTDEGLANYRGNGSDKRKPLYMTAGTYKGANVDYSSMFAKFDSYLGPYFGYPDVAHVDTARGIMRHSLINIMPLELIQFAVKDEMAKERDKVLFGERILLYVKDTAHYTDNRHWYYYKVVDTLYSNRLSYEQITPLGMAEERRSALMLADLNNYFSDKFGTTIKVERKKIPCYILVRTSTSDKMAYKEGADGEASFPIIDGKKMRRVRGMTLDDSFKAILPFYEVFKALSVNDVLLDETGYEGKVNIVVPANVLSMSLDDLRKALQQYDLDIVQGEREVNMLVIEEKDYKGVKLF